jgi:hypothetical protein
MGAVNTATLEHTKPPQGTQGGYCPLFWHAASRSPNFVSFALLLSGKRTGLLAGCGETDHRGVADGL